MFSLVKPDDWVVLRLASDSLKLIQLVPNTTIAIPKYGSFQTNALLGRPYNLTYEFGDKKPGQSHSTLRRVPASEIHADTFAEEEAQKTSPDDKVVIGGGGLEFSLLGEDGEVVMRSNREIIDDGARQTLTMEEIETLKREGADAGKDIIAKLMLSHTAMDKKTAFSMAKYKLLKTKKFLRQFTVLPLDVPMLTQYLMDERDPSKIYDMREEMLALLGCWGNVHFSGDDAPVDPAATPGGRWLVVDETGGLIVAAMAERMGILHPQSPDEEEQEEEQETAQEEQEVTQEETRQEQDTQPNGDKQSSSPTSTRKAPARPTSAADIHKPLAKQNTLTLIHPNAEPNLALLKYFHYLPNLSRSTHPLATHLHTLSWLQLLSPSDDVTYGTPPPSATPAEIQSWKSGKRTTYYRKRRRFTKVREVVHATQAGGFDGLIVATTMDPVGILRSCVPLLRGGAQVAIYSKDLEPLQALADVYSVSRRTAFISNPPDDFKKEFEQDQAGEEGAEKEDKDPALWPGNEDFPLNPTVLLNVNVQTSRVRKWQVLPGRTHPLMTGKGGSEGFLFTAVRVMPAKGRVAARGKFNNREKRRKIEPSVGQEKGEAAKEKVEVSKEKTGAENGQVVGGDADGDTVMEDAAAGDS